MVELEPDDRRPAQLRRAYGCFPSGVTAICALEGGARRSGSLRARSPRCPSIRRLVSVCVQNTSATWPRLRAMPRLGVSVLAEDQNEACAGPFAQGRGPVRRGRVERQRGRGGVRPRRRRVAGLLDPRGGRRPVTTRSSCSPSTRCVPSPTAARSCSTAAASVSSSLSERHRCRSGTASRTPPPSDEERQLMSSIDEAIEEIAAGRAVVVVDDEERENEGDLIFAAELASPELMAFLVRYSSGFVCVALPEQECERLALPPMHHTNSDGFGTAYRLTVDAVVGVTTGISARDRARTARLLADPDCAADRPQQAGPRRPSRRPSRWGARARRAHRSCRGPGPDGRPPAGRCAVRDRQHRGLPARWPGATSSSSSPPPTVWP